jgi:hypothetical protein
VTPEGITGLRDTPDPNRQGAGLGGRRRSRRAASIATAVVCLAFAAAACGGSPGAGIANVATTTTAAPPAAAVTSGTAPGGELAEYSTCMRTHGISGFPGSGSYGSSDSIKAAKGQIARVSQSEGSTPAFEAAQRACAKYYGPTAPPKHVSPEEMQKLLAVSRCMRSHGVPSFPDPNPTTGDFNTPAGVDRTSPQVVAALTACSALGRAAGLGPPTTGP